MSYQPGDVVVSKHGDKNLKYTVSHVLHGNLLFFEETNDSAHSDQVCPVKINRYGLTLTNENLEVGDKVYPISCGKSNDKDFSYHHEYFYFGELKEIYQYDGFPNNCFEDEPHIILDLNYSRDCKAYEIRTNFGYGPKEKYFKIINQ